MADLSGRTIKGYELREYIGRGGLGAVNRDVAVKVILAEHADQPDFIRRFEAEAQDVSLATGERGPNRSAARVHRSSLC